MGIFGLRADLAQEFARTGWFTLYRGRAARLYNMSMHLGYKYRPIGH